VTGNAPTGSSWALVVAAFVALAGSDGDCIGRGGTAAANEAFATGVDFVEFQVSGQAENLSRRTVNPE